MENIFFVELSNKGNGSHMFALPGGYSGLGIEDVLEKCFEHSRGEDEADALESALRELKKDGYLLTTGQKQIRKKAPVLEYMVREKARIEGNPDDISILYIDAGYNGKEKKEIMRSSIYNEEKAEQQETEHKSDARSKGSREKHPKRAGRTAPKTKKVILSKRAKNTLKAAGFILYTGFMMYCMNRCDSVYYRHRYGQADSCRAEDVIDLDNRQNRR